MKTRSKELEIMDLGPAHYTMDEYYDCLRKLGILGNLLGSDRATIRAMKALHPTPQSFLDVGCGGGSFACKIARTFNHAQVCGIDIDTCAIQYAQNILDTKNSSLRDRVRFVHRSKPELSEPEKSFDVVTATLVCHHLSDDQLIDFFIRAGKVARQAIVINDLHRHPLAIFAYKLITPFLRNRLCVFDGLCSIRRAFTRSELEQYLHAAGYTKAQYVISWRPLFRWIIVVNLN